MIHWLRKPLSQGKKSRATNKSIEFYDNDVFKFIALEKLGFSEFFVKYKGVRVKLGFLGKEIVKVFDYYIFTDTDFAQEITNVFPLLKQIFFVCENSASYVALDDYTFSRSFRLERIELL